jgi:hypothetical protein
MTPEEKLFAVFAAETPPVRDLVFEAEVARRLAARRAVTRSLAAVPATVAACACLWALGEAIPGGLSGALAAGVMVSASSVWSVAAVLAATGAAGLVWLSGRLSAA